MKHIPWPFWMLAGFATLCVLASGVVRLVVEDPSMSSALEWATSGTALVAVGYVWFRWLARRRRPFDERWAERAENRTLDLRSR